MEIGWSELLIIGVVALIVIGPKDLPEMFRTLGRFTAKMRAMARDFSRAMEDAARDTGVKDVADDLRKVTSPKSLGLEAVKSAADKFEKWDPLKGTRPGAAGSAAATATAPAAAAPVTLAEGQSPLAGETAAAPVASASDAAPIAAPVEVTPLPPPQDAEEIAASVAITRGGRLRSAQAEAGTDGKAGGQAE